MSQSIKAAKLVEEIVCPSARHALRARAVIPFAGKMRRDGRVFREYVDGTREEVCFPVKCFTVDYYDALVAASREEDSASGCVTVTQPELFTPRVSPPENFACTGAEVPKIKRAQRPAGSSG